MYYIYLILNKVNGKTYVGQRKSSKEWNNDSYMGSGKLLKLAKKKHGIKNFEKFLIQYCYSKEETDKAEKFWITEYRSRGKAEYNIADGGQGYYAIGKNHPMYGKHHSEETKRKLSESCKEAFKSEVVKQKLSKAHKGKCFSEEHKQNLSESLKGKNKGKHRSDEQKRRMSETMKGDNNPFYGRQHSDETKLKISESKKGNPAWNKGKKLGSNGTHWYNNGEVNVKAKECPEGFVKGRLYIWQK